MSETTMGPRKPTQGGLANAQDQIAMLMRELDSTLELVEKLTEHGEEGAALKLIDGQRAELHRVVDTISRDVARDRRGWFEGARRNATALVAAATLALSTLAVGVATITRRAPAPTASEISAAAQIADPAERIQMLIKIKRQTEQLPAEASGEVVDDLLPALGDAVDDAKDEGVDDALIRDAERAMKDLEEGRPPEPPAAPGDEQGPVETVQEIIDGP